MKPMDVSLGLVPLARPTFDIALATQVANQVRSRLERAGFSLTGPETLISDGDEARKVAQELAEKPPDLLLILQTTFADSTMVTSLAQAVDAPLLLWAVPEARTGGRLRLNSLCGINLAAHALKRAGYRYDYVYAEPDAPGALEQVRTLALAGRARRLLRHAQIGRVGEHPAGLDTCRVDQGALERHFGLRVLQVDLEEVLHGVQTADPQKIEATLGECYLDRLVAGWPVMTIHVNQMRPLFVNAQTEDDLPALWQGLCLLSQPASELLADAVFMERHFARPRWNTRLGREGEVTVYRFWLAESVLHVEERSGTRQAFPLREVGRFPWQTEALATRRAYLERWLRRQLPIRLANNVAVASPLPGRHVATCYLRFLLEIDWRLAVLAPALAQVRRKGTIDRGIVLEAIRGSDGLLRAWCQSARLGVTNALDI